MAESQRESGVIRLDSGWYTEYASLPILKQLEMEELAVSDVLGDISKYLALTESEPFITAPILSQEKWEGFVETLELHKGEGVLDIFTSLQASNPSVAARL